MPPVREMSAEEFRTLVGSSDTLMLFMKQDGPKPEEWIPYIELHRMQESGDVFSRTKATGVVCTCNAWQPLVESGSILRLPNYFTFPISIMSILESIGGSLPQHPSISNTVFHLVIQNIGLFKATESLTYKYRTKTYFIDELEWSSPRELHQRAIYVRRLQQPDLTSASAGVVQVCGGWAPLISRGTSVTVLPTATDSICNELISTISPTGNNALPPHITYTNFQISDERLKVFSSSYEKIKMFSYKDSAGKVFVLNKFTKNRRSFFQHLSPLALSAAMIRSSRPSASSPSDRTTPTVSISGSWESLVSSSYIEAVRPSEKFLDDLQVYLQRSPTLNYPQPSITFNTTGFDKFVKRFQHQNTSKAFECGTDDIKPEIKRVDILGQDDSILNSFYTLSPGYPRLNPSEHVSRDWETLVESRSPIKIVPDTGEALLETIRQYLLNGVSRFPHLRTVVFCGKGQRLLSGDVGEQRIIAGTRYESTSGLLHEFVVLSMGSRVNGQWEKKYFLRLERDKTRWLAIWSKNLTEEYVNMCNSPEPLIDPDSRCKLSFTVNGNTPDCHRPNCRGILSITDRIYSQAPVYSLIDRNCWWYAERLTNGLIGKIGSRNITIIPSSGTSTPRSMSVLLPFFFVLLEH